MLDESPILPGPRGPRRTRFLTLLIAAGLSLPPAVCLAQVTARQGEKQAPEAQRFVSPMVLEFPVEFLREDKKGTSRHIAGIGAFSCDDVRIVFLLVTKKSISGEGAMRLDIQGALEVAPSHDRLVSLRFDFLAGDRIVRSLIYPRLDAEEGKALPFLLHAELNPGQTEKLLASDQKRALRITMTVTDNS